MSHVFRNLSGLPRNYSLDSQSSLSMVTSVSPPRYYISENCVVNLFLNRIPCISYRPKTVSVPLLTRSLTACLSLLVAVVMRLRVRMRLEDLLLEWLQKGFGNPKSPELQLGFIGKMIWKVTFNWPLTSIDRKKEKNVLYVAEQIKLCDYFCDTL